MDIRAEEISDIIRKQIKNYDKKVEVTETGTVLTVGDGIARVYGLVGRHGRRARRVPRRRDGQGMVLNLEEDNVGVALLGEFEAIREGDIVKRTGRIVEVPVGEELLGRVVNALGEPVDAARPITGTKTPPGRDQGARHHRRASRCTSRCRPASRRSTR